MSRNTAVRVGGAELAPSSFTGRRSLIAGCVSWIISGFNLREPLKTSGMDLCDPVLEGRSLDVIFHVAILESSFEGDELPFLEGPGEL
jgi:hypothetical protein